MKKKYLIWGYYGFGNLGDELMLRVITQKIRDKDPGSVIYVKCYNPPAISDIIPFPVEKTRIPLPFLTTAVYLLKVLRLILKIDILVIGGGTLFLDKGVHNLSMLILAVAVSFASLMGKKIYVIGVGIDLLTNPMNICYLRYILRKSDYTCLRDDYSFTYANYLCGGNALRTSDIVFEERFMASLTEGAASGKDHIAVSLTDYFKGMRERLLRDRAVLLIEMLLREYPDNYSVVLCAFQKTLGERDYEFLEDLMAEVIKRNKEYEGRLRLVLLESEEQIRDIFGRAVCTIGMRYHALVLSAIFKRPFMGLNMEMKIKEICVELGMPFINIEDFLKHGIPQDMIQGLLGMRISEETIRRQIELSKANWGWLG